MDRRWLWTLKEIREVWISVEPQEATTERTGELLFGSKKVQQHDFKDSKYQAIEDYRWPLDWSTDGVVGP